MTPEQQQQQRIKNIVYEVSHTYRLIADIVTQLERSGHLPPEFAGNLLQLCTVSQTRLKQIVPKDK